MGARRLAGTGYQLEALLGRGAASEVWSAIDDRGRACALKLLAPVHAPGGEVAKRMRQEARALAGVEHPNVVALLDVGVTEDGRPYLVMPRLAGETLEARLAREGRLPARVACALLAGALDGLAAAHASGVVHRDVKPANLFVTGGRLVVLDFGIAKLDAELRGGAVASTAGHVIGTPRWLAPEQVLGGRVDGRTDVHAAGLVAFLAIAGVEAYAVRGALDAIRAPVRAIPRRLDGVVGCRRALAEVVAVALAKRPDERWPSASSFALALRRAALAEAA